MLLLIIAHVSAKGMDARSQCATGDKSCALHGGTVGAGEASEGEHVSLLPVYHEVEPGSTTAVCIVSKESELPGINPPPAGG